MCKSREGFVLDYSKNPHLEYGYDLCVKGERIMCKTREGFVLDYSKNPHLEYGYDLCVMVDVLSTVDEQTMTLYLTDEFAKFVGGEEYLHIDLMRGIPKETTEAYVEKFEAFVKERGVTAFIKKMNPDIQDRIKECGEESFVDGRDILLNNYIITKKMADRIMKEILGISFIPVSELERRISLGYFNNIEIEVRNIFNKEGKVPSITYFRQQTGYGLREAKDTVELLMGIHDSQNKEEMTEEKMVETLEEKGYQISKPNPVTAGLGVLVKFSGKNEHLRAFKAMIVLVDEHLYVVDVDETSIGCGSAFHKKGLKMEEATVHNFNKVMQREDRAYKIVEGTG